MDVHMSSVLTLIILFIGCVSASVIDWRIRKIPNAIPIAWGFCALILQSVHGPATVVTVMAIGLAILFAGTGLFAIGWLGGGDVKMLAAGAMLLGPSYTVEFLISSLMAGGALAMITLLLKGRLIGVFQDIFLQLQLFKVNSQTRFQATSGVRLPYAIAISAGAFITSSTAYFPALIRIS